MDALLKKHTIKEIHSVYEAKDEFYQSFEKPIYKVDLTYICEEKTERNIFKFSFKEWMIIKANGYFFA